jgi:P27 family predicted phage terminase small subunit
LRSIEGDRSHRRPNAREPRPPAARPSPPRELDAVARREWNRVVPLLEGLQLLTTLDRAALAAYCFAYSAMISCALDLQRYDRGEEIMHSPARNSLVAALGTAQRLVATWCSRFGLTPSDRCRMVAPGQDDAEDDPISALIDGRDTSSGSRVHDLAALVGATDAGRDRPE